MNWRKYTAIGRTLDLEPRKRVKTIFRAAVILEVMAFAGCFAFYVKTNRDQEFRFKLSQTSVGKEWLEAYYMLGEKMNSDLKIRERDIATWRSQGRIQ